jgi:uncharacterized membrane protein YbhN (UPF0104 family)
MTNNKQPDKRKNRESSIRWQGRTIEQLGYALNLILGLTVAALGFEVSLILNKDFHRAGWQKCILSISLLALVLSVAVGLWCVLNRLRDFRTTAETAWKRENDASDIKLQPLRTLTRTLGKRTWVLFQWQLWSFSLGVLLLVVGVAGSFGITLTN